MELNLQCVIDVPLSLTLFSATLTSTSVSSLNFAEMKYIRYHSRSHDEALRVKYQNCHSIVDFIL